MTGAEEREDLSRNWLINQAVEINTAVEKYLRLVRVATARAATAAAEVEADAEITRAPLMGRIEYYLFLVGLVAIYVIDLLLFGVAAEYLAAAVGGARGSAAHLARYVVLAVFLAIELALGIRIERARRESRHFFGSALARKCWTALGLVVALMMPLAAAGMARAAREAGDSLSFYLIAFLGILSFTCHVLVLFGGRFTMEAKAHVVYAVSRLVGEKRAELADGRAKQARTLANAMFMSYAHALREHNARYKAVPSGPFDAEVVDYLRREFPHVTLRTAGCFPDAPDGEAA
ncbi:MAG TPA: hypothetical protein VJ276_07545 [Thermoanaerobaculia bacterium]|nr:hypothetical protein [Thermoanaerobaculia bacterium]